MMDHEMERQNAIIHFTVAYLEIMLNQAQWLSRIVYSIGIMM